MTYEAIAPNILVKKIPAPASKVFHVMQAKQIDCEVVDVFTGCPIQVGQKVTVPVHQIKFIPDTELGLVDASEEGAHIIIHN